MPTDQKKSDYVLTSEMADWVEEMLGVKLLPWQRHFGARHLGKVHAADEAWEWTLERALENAAKNGTGVASVTDKALRAVFEVPEIPAGEIYHFPSREQFDQWWENAKKEAA